VKTSKSDKKEKQQTVIMDSRVSPKLANYLSSIRSMGQWTAIQYESRLNDFARFVHRRYHIDIDDLIDKLDKLSNRDDPYQYNNPYQILIEYTAYLTGKFSPATIKQRVTCVKNFFEYFDIEISPRKFRLMVKLPKNINKDENKKTLTKTEVIEILNACSDLRLRTYILLLAATGMRASEALSIRICDLDLISDPSKVFLRGEYTKTKRNRVVLLTRELITQITTWLAYKYRTRRVTHHNPITNKSVSDFKTPHKNDKDLIFSMKISPATKRNDYFYLSTSSIRTLYAEMAKMFGRTLDLIGKGGKEDLPGSSRRHIHLHLLRAFVKSTITDLGYTEFSEYFIGHSGSTYYRRSEKERAQIFKKIEPYLTFLDYEVLERKGADIASQLEEKDRMIQNMMLKQEKFEQLIQSLIDSGQLKPSKIQ
jgi:integrase